MPESPHVFLRNADVAQVLVEGEYSRVDALPNPRGRDPVFPMKAITVTQDDRLSPFLPNPDPHDSGISQ